MGVKVTGFNETMGSLEKKLGEEQMRRLSVEAVDEAAHDFARILGQELARVDGPYRQGGTVEEIEVVGPISETKDGETVFKIKWGKERYNIIHLNEWGTVRIPNPPLKGVIAKTLKNTEKRYYDLIKEKIRKGVMR